MRQVRCDRAGRGSRVAARDTHSRTFWHVDPTAASSCARTAAIEPRPRRAVERDTTPTLDLRRRRPTVSSKRSSARLTRTFQSATLLARRDLLARFVATTCPTTATAAQVPNLPVSGRKVVTPSEVVVPPFASREVLAAMLAVTSRRRPGRVGSATTTRSSLRHGRRSVRQ